MTPVPPWLSRVSFVPAPMSDRFRLAGCRAPLGPDPLPGFYGSDNGG